VSSAEGVKEAQEKEDKGGFAAVEVLA
jgi:hypothetical protein